MSLWLGTLGDYSTLNKFFLLFFSLGKLIFCNSIEEKQISSIRDKRGS